MLSNLIIPKHLNSGDKVATVSLSWGGPGDARLRARYEIGKKQLQETFGVQVVEMPHTLKDPDFIYKNPQARADDLHEAFLNPGIKAVISTIGGSDSVRLIDKVDLNILRNNPKIFLGYSDATVTNFMCLAAGLRSYNGPAIMTQCGENGGMHDYVVASMRKTLFSNEVIGEIAPSAEGYTTEHVPWEDSSTFSQKRTMNPQTGWHYIQGEAPVSGRLIGGCGETHMMFVGSKIWSRADLWKDAILFMENSEDAISAEQFLYNMRCFGAQGIIQTLKGILFAKPCRVPLEKWADYGEMLKRVTAEFDRPDIPIVTHMDFGHVDPIFTLPFGAMATIDPAKKRFSIDEPGCL
ncbi:S66 family peptidase [Stigmatella aurantiaca]|uniref:Peptidase S66, LD-carboxypeptidase A family protein n=1 Tax=Stigmatella aurantiaca (strain DW4/3-1) TaxID=378806 RepID=E3FEC7_STIAD|nr:S66 peptidase family protein [Stigmatella aurantiaca]ADO73897.1 Peptidase S66, LD-carboxypeptidase A family protein [Stigmatella aurantiaca DW4/3-1]